MSVLTRARASFLNRARSAIAALRGYDANGSKGRWPAAARISSPMSEAINARETIAATCIASLKYIACFWAFIGIRGAATITELLTRAGKKAKKRGHFIDCPTNVYIKVDLNRKRPAQAAVTSTDESEGVAYHKVTGHWRRYHAAEGIVWRCVEEYYRGNPELGIVVKERQA